MADPGGIGNAFLGRVPPHSREAELSVIGGVLLHNDALDRVADILEPGDFYSEGHGIIYGAILEMQAAGKAVDVITLGERLRDGGTLESAGGLSYLSGILDAVPTSANIEAHAREVAEKAQARACIGAALDILEKGFGDYGDIEAFVDEAEGAMYEACRAKAGHRNIRHASDVAREALGEIEALRDHTGDVTGVDTGFWALNRLTTGLQPADLVVVAGRPGMGKTAIGEQLALRAALYSGGAAALFTIEMRDTRLMRRLLSLLADVRGENLRVPSRLTREELDRITDAAGTIGGSSLYIDDSASISVLDIRARARRVKAARGLSLVVVDYLQIMRPVRGSGAENRERAVAEMTAGLKGLAKDLDVPVVAISQLNRKCEERKDKRPNLGDLRESGAIEQDADLILFLYRGGYYGERGVAVNLAELDVAKNRNGPCGLVRLQWDAEKTAFYDWEDEAAVYGGAASGDRRRTVPACLRPPTEAPPPEQGKGKEETPF